MRAGGGDRGGRVVVLVMEDKKDGSGEACGEGDTEGGGSADIGACRGIDKRLIDHACSARLFEGSAGIAVQFVRDTVQRACGDGSCKRHPKGSVKGRQIGGGSFELRGVSEPSDAFVGGGSIGKQAALEAFQSVGFALVEVDLFGLIAALAAVNDGVRTRLKAKMHRLAEAFFDLRKQKLFFRLEDVVMACKSGIQDQAGRGFLRVSQDHMSMPSKRLAEAWVLHTAGEKKCVGDGFLVGVAVGFFERHKAVLVVIGKATQSRDQMVSKDRAAKAFEFVGIFADTAGGEDGLALEGRLPCGRKGEMALDPPRSF